MGELMKTKKRRRALRHFSYWEWKTFGMKWRKFGMNNEEKQWAGTQRSKTTSILNQFTKQSELMELIVDFAEPGSHLFFSITFHGVEWNVKKRRMSPISNSIKIILSINGFFNNSQQEKNNNLPLLAWNEITTCLRESKPSNETFTNSFRSPGLILFLL